MFAIIQRILATRLFRRTENLQTIPQIVWWWELRRVPYNLIVGLVGVLTCAVMFAVLMIFPSFDESGGGGSPLLEVMAVILYGIAANICYTGGWITEILAKKLWKERAEAIGEISFALGLVFSAMVTFLPAIIYFCVAVFTTASHRA